MLLCCSKKKVKDFSGNGQGSTGQGSSNMGNEHNEVENFTVASKKQIERNGAGHKYQNPEHNQSLPSELFDGAGPDGASESRQR